ncbi:hypothetical protein CXB49_13810 [Chromobacterium sp. ATCC 53434]|uniref:hypothetical protein n=1 Tax=Chromobacterium sp. (strain ATCC 53434 / SC 14030) TaxID=2059672 RepID=UPI000C792A67|nr:hypothetical protein [Chromobacterium sp. ATCC 53434]AUH51819.1 hypothetical protein CXB49_13810 [Chromobacterium sp. ATCC 53434]
MPTTFSSINPAGGESRWRKDGAAVAPAAAFAQTGGRAALAGAQPSQAGPSGWRYSTQLNEQLSAAQCAQGFVDDMLRQLQDFKDNLSRQLTQRRLDGASLSAQRDALGQAWQSRRADSAGSLDSQLRLTLGAPARQNFTARGLDLDSLTSGPAETLSFTAGGVATALRVGDGVTREQILRGLNQALGPVGARCELDDHGRLGFSSGEKDWAQLQGGLTVRGGGVRFPGGVPQPLALEAEAPALDAARWQVDDHAQVRLALQDVLRSIARLQQTRASIDSAIAEARRSISQLSRSDEQSWASAFVGDFNARLNQSADFGHLQQLVPALLGISRYRVVALLSLR